MEHKCEKHTIWNICDPLIDITRKIISISSLNSIFWSGNIVIKTELLIYNTIVKSILVSETKLKVKNKCLIAEIFNTNF